MNKLQKNNNNNNNLNDWLTFYVDYLPSSDLIFYTYIACICIKLIESYFSRYFQKCCNNIKNDEHRIDVDCAKLNIASPNKLTFLRLIKSIILFPILLVKNIYYILIQSTFDNLRSLGFLVFLIFIELKTIAALSSRAQKIDANSQPKKRPNLQLNKFNVSLMQIIDNHSNIVEDKSNPNLNNNNNNNNNKLTSNEGRQTRFRIENRLKLKFLKNAQKNKKKFNKKFYSDLIRFSKGIEKNIQLL